MITLSDLRRRIVVSLVLVLAAWSTLSIAPAVHGASPLPARLGDREFWRLITDLSEPGGSFRSDNLVSNETTFQHVIPTLQQRVPAGGVYIGVGPDQNFTYIAALKPRMAFIVDIRRENLLLHLMYKALMEDAADRAEFLSHLFSRQAPAGLSRSASTSELFDTIGQAEPNDTLFQRNLARIFERLRRHRFPLTAADRAAIEHAYRAFYTNGPDLRYSYGRGFGGRWFPSYADLMLESDAEGEHHSYLATEDNFRFVKSLEERNLVVSVVGNFGGDKALRAVGQYLRDHGAVVGAFYTSNVEQYLFMGDDWKRFFDNVSTLPLDERSTFIRACFFNWGFRDRFIPAGRRSVTLLDPIALLLKDVEGGRVQGYSDLFERER